MITRRLFTVIVCLSAWAGACVDTTFGGSIFLTGHDPDFHAQVGNTTGARNIINVAINYVLDGAFNPYTNATAGKFLYVQSKGPVPAGHLNGVAGITASGYTEGIHFEHHDYTTLGAELSLLGSKYAGVVVASDFGGILRQAELDILNARSSDIISFLNSGGGLFAMAQGNGGAGLTPDGGHFGFLPFVVSSTAVNHFESGFAVTAFGASLGLTDADVNGNFSHNIFTSTSGLQIVDTDASGTIYSLAGRGLVDPDSGLIPVPLPGAALGGIVLLSGLGAARFARRRRRI